MVVSFQFATPDGDGRSRLVCYGARRDFYHGLLVAALGASAILAASIGFVQVEDPVPEPITNRGLRVEITDVARLADSRTKHPPEEDVDPNAWARVSFVRDLPDGRRFADDSIPETVAAIEEIQLYVRNEDGSTRDVTLWELVEETMGRTVIRADLQVSEGRDGEIFITSRQDGVIRMLGAIN